MQIILLNPNDIKIPAGHIRQNINDGQVAALAKSIQNEGLLQPISDFRNRGFELKLPHSLL
jgi:ParB-like chromosome segregation protein Spo0J